MNGLHIKVSSESTEVVMSDKYLQHMPYEGVRLILEHIAAFVNKITDKTDTTPEQVELLTNLSYAATQGTIEATHRFKTSPENELAGGWFKDQQGRAVAITNKAGEYWDGVFVDDGLPFSDVHCSRFEVV